MTFHLQNEAIHSMRTLVEKLSQNQLTAQERQCVLDVFILLYSSKKLWPEDSEQLQEIQGQILYHLENPVISLP